MRFRNRLAFGGSCSLNLPDRLRFGCKQGKWLTLVLIESMLFSTCQVCVVFCLGVVHGRCLVVTADCAKFI